MNKRVHDVLLFHGFVPRAGLSQGTPARWWVLRKWGLNVWAEGEGLWLSSRRCRSHDELISLLGERVARLEASLASDAPFFSAVPPPQETTIPVRVERGGAGR